MIAALHAEGWQSFRAFLPSEVVASRTLERRLREWPHALRDREVILAEENGGAVGFLSARLDAGRGELSTFFVTAEARGRGVGTRLLAAAARRSSDQGARAVFVNTFAEGSACVLFDRLGGDVVCARLRELDGISVQEVVYEWTGLALGRLVRDADRIAG